MNVFIETVLLRENEWRSYTTIGTKLKVLGNNYRIMEVITLENMNVLTIYSTFEDAFTGYFVELEKNPRPHIDRWLASGVDFSLSYGVKNEGQLVAFILHAPRGDTVMNLATGVRREFQGKGLLSLMYQRIRSELPGRGIKRSQLEVITENFRAIRGYETAGFRKSRKLLCWKGTLSELQAGAGDYAIAPLSFTDEHRNLTVYPPAFEMDDSVLLRRSDILELHELRIAGELRAYAVWNPWKMNLARLEGKSAADLETLLAKMNLSEKSLGILNVDERNETLNRLFLEKNLVNYISQYEMETLF